MHTLKTTEFYTVLCKTRQYRSKPSDNHFLRMALQFACHFCWTSSRARLIRRPYCTKLRDTIYKRTRTIYPSVSTTHYYSSETYDILLVPCGPRTRKLPDVDDSRSDTLASVLLATGDRLCSAAAARRCSWTEFDLGDRRGSGGTGGSWRLAVDSSLLFFFRERWEPRPPVLRGSAVVTTARFSCVVDGDQSAAVCRDLYLDSLSVLVQPVARLLPYDGLTVHGPMLSDVVSAARRSAVSTMQMPVSSLAAVLWWTLGRNVLSASRLWSLSSLRPWPLSAREQFSVLPSDWASATPFTCHSQPRPRTCFT